MAVKFRRKELAMSKFELPSPQQENDHDISLLLIQGEGPLKWDATAEALGAKVPNPATFNRSNLKSRIHLIDRTVRTSARGVTTPEVIPKTSRAAIIGEVYRHCLPKGYEDTVKMLEAQALAAEADYEAMGIPGDRVYQAHLDDFSLQHADSLIMQGFEAFSEAVWDYNGGLHEPLIREAQRFAAFLIETDAEA